MMAVIEFDGHSVGCDLLYPYSENPITVSGVQGTQIWQQTNFDSNAKLILQTIIELPNKCEIKTATKTYMVNVINKQHANEVWCNIS